ncbi:trypco2 family protein [Kitasatospora sp. NPDC002227]|uniref:trypco2 family protein n=1 Tax=Kitasatospora sp. NPDC002227 TaxID=3154773 RepID=UPI00332B7F40
MESGIELADAVEAVRQQLAEAAERGAGQGLVFEVGEVKLEFSVELKRDTTVKGGIKALVWSLDAEAGVAHQRSHKISVSLTPKDTITGGSVEVGNSDLGSRDGF